MAGPSRAHLVLASDHRKYIVKHAANPLGPETLVNEWVGGAILDAGGIATPLRQRIEIDQNFLETNPAFAAGYSDTTALSGTAFASLLIAEYPAHKDVSLFDFMPSTLLHKVENRHDLHRLAELDKVFGHAGLRQVVYARLPQGTYRAYAIDQGEWFNGAAWTVDPPTGDESARPFLTAEFVESILKEIPVAWFNGRQEVFRTMISQSTVGAHRRVYACA